MKIRKIRYKKVKIIPNGYIQITNDNDGDNDFILIDTMLKQYIWCENGTYPFSSPKDRVKYQSLQEMVDCRD